MFPRPWLLASLTLVASLHTATDRAQICHPPHFGGIVPGITLDRDVVAMHGAGFFSEELGHGGGRYYTDSARTVTLIATIGVDNAIESVQLIQGLEFPGYAPADPTPFVSPRLDARDNGWLRVGIGATREQVRKAHGEPSARYQDGSNWNYQTDMSGCTIDASVNFVFTGDRVTQVVFYNGE